MTNKYLLYVDFLGFAEMAIGSPENVRRLYRIVEELNCHKHDAFNAIVFSDTLLVYNKDDAFFEREHRYVVNFIPELHLPEFLALDDHSMLHGIRCIRDDKTFSHLAETGRQACEELLKTVTTYECRILPKPTVSPLAGPGPRAALRLPNNLFFDLMLDHDEDHRLYIPGSVRVEQLLTRTYARKDASICLAECSGALGPVLSSNNRAPLVRDSFLLFRPRTAGGDWHAVDRAIENHAIHDAIDREDVSREIAFHNDTWGVRGFKGQRVAISCSFQDRPTIVRVLRALYAEKQRYRVLLDSLLWLGNTALENSRQLVKMADAVLVIVSQAYLKSATECPGGNIAVEVKEIYAKATSAKQAPVVVLPVDSYEVLKDFRNWSWSALHPKWPLAPILVPPDTGLRNAGHSAFRSAVRAAIEAMRGAVK